MEKIGPRTLLLILYSKRMVGVQGSGVGQERGVVSATVETKRDVVNQTTAGGTRVGLSVWSE